MDMALGSNPDPDKTMAQDGSVGHTDLYGRGSSMAFRQQLGRRCLQTPSVHMAFSGNLGHGY